MLSLVERVNRSLTPRKSPRCLEFDFAGESYGCDPAISEVTVPHVVVYIPKSVIRMYNLATAGRNSEALPDATEFWQFLSPQLVGNGLVAPNEYASVRPVDDVVRELLRWPHQARFECFSNTRAGVLLDVKAAYDPYWDEDS